MENDKKVVNFLPANINKINVDSKKNIINWNPIITEDTKIISGWASQMAPHEGDLGDQNKYTKIPTDYYPQHIIDKAKAENQPNDIGVIIFVVTFLVLIIFLMILLKRNKKEQKVEQDEMKGEGMEDLHEVSLETPKISCEDEIQELSMKKTDPLKRYVVFRNLKYSILDTDTNFEIPLKYDSVEPFSEDLAVVKLKQGDGTKCGYIDKYGKEVIPIEYSSAKNFNNGLAIVSNDKDRKGCIDKQGKLIIPFKYMFFDDFDENGFAEIQMDTCSSEKNAGCGYVNKLGEEVIPPIYGYYNNIKYGKRGVSYLSKELLLFRVFVNNFWGVVDSNNKIVIPAEYDDIILMNNVFIIVERNDCYGIVKIDGTPITPVKYQDMGYFQENLAQVKIEDKWGFVNTNGDEIISAKYSSVSDFKEGLSIVLLNDYYGLINCQGESIISARHEELKPCVNGIFIAKSGNKWGGFDKKGNAIIPIEYDEINPFTGEKLFLRKGENWVSMNKNGQLIEK